MSSLYSGVLVCVTEQDDGLVLITGMLDHNLSLEFTLVLVLVPANTRAVPGKALCASDVLLATSAHQQGENTMCKLNLHPFAVAHKRRET